MGGFDCDCVGGYNGIKCEANIDDCADEPCENGGTCTVYYYNLSLSMVETVISLLCRMISMTTCVSVSTGTRERIALISKVMSS